MIDENVPGVIEQRNAYFSVVSYMRDEEKITTVVDNNDFEVTGQIGYESD
jgi:hypothetical protein